MHLRKLAVLAALGITGAFAACTLNPQPLPPGNDNEASNFGDDAGAGSRADASVFSPGTADAASPTPSDKGDGGTGSGDAGDGGDGGSDGGDGGDAGDGG